MWCPVFKAGRHGEHISMNSTLTFIAVVAVILALCAWIGAIRSKERAAALESALKDQFGKVPDKKMSPLRWEKVNAYYLRHPPEDGIDDITWNDLDMDAVYTRMDSTLSGAGEEYLYALLRSPVRGLTSPKVSKDLIRYFEEDEHTQVRIAFQKALSAFGHSGKYSIYDYLDLLDEVPTQSNMRQLPVFLLPLLSLALLFVSVPAGVVCLIASLCWNMVTYYRRKGEIEPYIVSFYYLLRMLRCADEVISVSCGPFAGEQAELAKMQTSFARFRRGSGILLSGSAMSSGNPIDIVLDYVRILFHVDLIKFNTMVVEAGKHREEMDAELTILGRLDAAIALASFEKSLPYTCDPILHEDGILEAEGIYHPLLSDPVPNSIRAVRPILLTGSNASGKSTFLKSIALCSLFAQTIGFCPAHSYSGRIYRIRSSMALRDSIRSGESYFMVEIKSLKRIADLAGDGTRPVLCCIDEVLRGTNTVERIAASTEILKAFASHGVLCCAATHDIELTSLLEDCYDNYHFEEDLRGGDVAFSYRLFPGRANARNAIRLLDAVGFDEDITGRALQRAERFEETGEW